MYQPPRYNKNNIEYCNNCGKYNHNSKQCTNPVISLGLIVYKKIQNKINFLMIRRRNSIGFVQIIRGKYAFIDVNYLQKLFNVLTNDEINLIKKGDFNELWESLWYDEKFNKKSYKTQIEYNNALEKFNKLKNGYKAHDLDISIDYFINNKKSIYNEQEWGFPKGRRKNKEGDFQTAVREFYEETNIKITSLDLPVEKIQFIEEYKSYDNIKYKNIYYLAEYIGNSEDILIDDKKAEQYSEVSSIEFLDLVSCISKIRDYEVDKKDLIIKVHSYLVNGNLL
jgi:8-oxo-dGTP pyrophosphatase MutT (NUDIX family)